MSKYAWGWIVCFTILLIRPSQHALAEPVDSVAIRSATTHMEVRDNRAFILLQVVGTNGRKKTALFWVDSGGDSVFLGGPLADELGLQKVGESFQAMGERPAHRVTKPVLSIAGMIIDIQQVPVSASESKFRNLFAGVEAEGFLPAAVLKLYDVVFDYPAHSFTLAHSGSLVHHGVPIPMSVKPETGLPRIEVLIAGQTYGFMLDTGAAYAGLSLGVMDKWIIEHPSWAHSVGAVGSANMVGKQYDSTKELLRTPEVRLGPIVIRNVGFMSQPVGVYETIDSADMTAPIVGVLAGNVLRHFRLDLDYPSGVAYVSPAHTVNAADLDCVGLIFQVTEAGSIVINGVAQRNAAPEVDRIQAGDILLRIDGHSVTGATRATVLNYLSGTVGEVRHLTIRRGLQEISISASVKAHP
jgi:PDZ domain